jgi:glycosyltransferase involved in cell wall biosynthesis
MRVDRAPHPPRSRRLVLWSVRGYPSSLVTTVGFVRHNFLPPSETFIYNTLCSLERYRAKVFAIARRMPEKFPFSEVTALRSLRFGWIDEILYRATTWSPRFFSWARGVRILHAHMGHTGAHALLAARRLGLPLVTSFYGRDVSVRRSLARLEPAHWHYWILGGRLFALGDRFLVLSRHMQSLIEAQGCAPDKIRIVRLGVDLDRFGGERPRRTGPCTVLMVGREVEKKGFDDGLRACAAARAQGADLRVVVLGTGEPGRVELQRLASRLGLDVAWPAPSTSVPAAMSDADLLLVPSRTSRDGDQEGTPTVIYEGSAAALPIVATRHAGIPEQVDDGTTGLLAEERDVPGLAGHLARLAGDPELRAQQGFAGRRKMEQQHSLASHARGVEAVYDELLR